MKARPLEARRTSEPQELPQKSMWSIPVAGKPNN
jgi:hypothetical protein